MRKWIIGAAVWLVLAACSDGKRGKAVDQYAKNRDAFTKTLQRNGFTLQFDYIPSGALSQSGNPADTLSENRLYHFRLQVICPVANDGVSKDKTIFYYGLDSLFTLGAENLTVMPVSVEPVTTGIATRFEYLVTIAAKDLVPGKQLEIIYHDRLFTNTRMSFVFDRTQIDELEKTYS
ncbi:hypothetical protein [Paraflavitalea pollutisoli]|uniref:hypothetical protein n=1 Tax=Paraflavitalea pollutisoli TaxID=3034143 RepID=UPI0023EC881C|nr:hypothetical protein [Paraflavitalea sp. H1-2-19X]